MKIDSALFAYGSLQFFKDGPFYVYDSDLFSDDEEYKIQLGCRLKYQYSCGATYVPFMFVGHRIVITDLDIDV